MSVLDRFTRCTDTAPILPPILYTGKDNRFSVKHILQDLKPYGAKDIVIIDDVPVNAAKFKAILSMASDEVIQWDGEPTRYIDLHHGRTVTRLLPWAWVKFVKGSKVPTYAFESHVIIMVRPS